MFVIQYVYCTILLTLTMQISSVVFLADDWLLDESVICLSISLSVHLYVAKSIVLK